MIKVKQIYKSEYYAYGFIDCSDGKNDLFTIYVISGIIIQIASRGKVHYIHIDDLLFFNL